MLPAGVDSRSGQPRLQGRFTFLGVIAMRVSSRSRPWLVVMGFVAAVHAMPSLREAARAEASDPGDYAGWKHSGRIHVLTTDDGAALPAGAVVEQFPLLVRLHRDLFPFAQARPDGADIRFADADGRPLAFQIDHWDAERGEAGVWVRMPRIEGQSRHTLRVYWGRPDAPSASDAQGVFNADNGYLSVWHLAADGADSAGSLQLEDKGTSSAPGVIGLARRFAAGQGLAGGERIETYPTGSEPHSSEAWFRAEKPNVRMLAWGNEQGQGKVVMQLRSPPHISMDCYFSDGNVSSRGGVSLGAWTHVAHTYEQGCSRLYIDGRLAGEQRGSGAPLNIRRPAKLWIGGWYGRYDFEGELDEVRVSRVSRSADWIRLQYENQKPLQSLVGPLVREGEEFTVPTDRVTVREGESVNLAAQIQGAHKIAWADATAPQPAAESLLAVDRTTLAYPAGRVVGNQQRTVRVKAVFPDGVRTKDIAIEVVEAIPEPDVTLTAPATWDGRSPIDVVPVIGNLATLDAAGGPPVQVEWSVAPLAVLKRVAADRLVLTRAQNSGLLTVTATVHNGGEPTLRSTTIRVTEPEHDAWVGRLPDPEERPVEHQFYARDAAGMGTLHYRGTLANRGIVDPVDAVFLRVEADGKPYHTARQKPAPNAEQESAFAFAVPLKAGLVRYRVQFGSEREGRETVVEEVGDLVCGDAFLINGQSNAVATDFGKEEPEYHSPWLRSFGVVAGDPGNPHAREWGEARHRSGDGGRLQIGYWGMELGRRLIEREQVPICIINGAVGGTRIDQHQRNPANPTDPATIYGRLLARVREARLTHGIRGILWHQGENDQGADGPTGGYGWETYRSLFCDMAAGWKEDYPNVQHSYVFQIWPKSCSMGVDGSDNRLREVQRTLPTAFSRLSVMSTLGIEPPGGCHFPAAGYAEFARLIAPLIQRDLYGSRPVGSITPPNLRRAFFTSPRRDEIVLEFDQPVAWHDDLLGEFTVGGRPTTWRRAAATDERLVLTLAEPATADRITYLDSKQWSQSRLLRGVNGIAALTFCEVPIEAADR